MPTQKNHAVYLLRHAQDFELTPQEKDDHVKQSAIWEKCKDIHDQSTWFSEKLLGNEPFRFPWKRLNEEGKDQARMIGEYLMDADSKGENLPIRRVIIQDPSGFDNSQNTLFTALPFIRALEKLNPNITVNVLGSDADFTDDSIVDIITETECSYSTVIVLDRQHLWGYKDESKKDKQPFSDPPASDSIVGKVFKRLFKDFDAGWKHQCNDGNIDSWKGCWKGNDLAQDKGGIIYKFSDTNDDGKLDFEGYKLEIEATKRKDPDGKTKRNARGIKLYDRTLKGVKEVFKIMNAEMQQ